VIDIDRILESQGIRYHLSSIPIGFPRVGFEFVMIYIFCPNVSVCRWQDTIYRALDAPITPAGDGSQVQLPLAEDTGFEVGDRAPVVTAPDIICIHTEDTVRPANDLVSIRR